MMNETNRPQTLMDALSYYREPDVCQQAPAAVRWPHGVTCPMCGSRSVAYLKNQRRWQCRDKHPRRRFSGKVGTLFEASPLPLSKRFAALWLIASAKKGISSCEIHRSLGVTQKSAWFMLHRIRLAMRIGTFEKLSGEVEADETLKNMPVEPVLPGVQGYRHGAAGAAWPQGRSRVVATVVGDRQKRTVQPVIRRNVEPGSTVSTDELLSYDGLADTDAHRFVNRTIEYVRGRIRTNTAENFRALLKRALGGPYVSVARSTCSATWTNRRTGSTRARSRTATGSAICCRTGSAGA